MPPFFNSESIAKPAATEGVEYTGESLANDAIDLDGDPLTFSKLAGPAWLTVAADGTLSGTPGVGDSGSFTVVVEDGQGGSDDAALNITVNAQSADTDPPTPDPATFAVAPTADSDTAISMTATTGSDASGPVEYLFTETSGNPGATSSAWQTSTSYTDSGLDASTQYTYTVTMRDSLGNTGTVSSPASATTQAAADTDPPTPNPATFASAPSADSSSAISMTTTTGSDVSGPLEYLFTETSGNPGGTSSSWQTSTSYTDSGLDASTQYTYTVTMRDSLNNTGTASSPASATTDAASIPLPGQASNPSPSDGSKKIQNPTLSWSAGTDATSHDVYFGTDSTPDSSELQGNQTGTSFDPGNLSGKTNYYWRIDEVNAAGTTTGTVWEFKTK
jgi:chitinase